MKDKPTKAEVIRALSDCYKLLYELGYGNGNVAQNALKLINRNK